MDERHEIRLREATPGNPPDLLDRIKDAISELFDCSISAGGSYVQGKSDEQELAKTAEIKAKALSLLANLDLERQRLLAERDRLLCEDKQKMYELETQRREAIINSLIKLHGMGVNVQIEIVAELLLKEVREY